MTTSEIRDQIFILSQYEPAVIAIDYNADDTGSLDRTERLNAPNLVLPLLISGSDSVRYSPNPFSNDADYGFVRVLSPSFFEPFIQINGRRYPAFATKILEEFDSRLYEKLTSRRLKTEIINYAGNIENFQYLGDLTALKSVGVLENIRGKIVILGYTGLMHPRPSEFDSYDAFVTPKGSMFGVLVHANILSTMFENYITPQGQGGLALMILGIIVANAFITFLLCRRILGYLLIKVAQAAQVLLGFVTCSFVIHRFQVALDYEMMTLAVLITPEIAYWLFKSREFS
ncbi:MAG TPA: CHASE2 domain-containing protein [Chryseosolibacter sp.]